MYYGNLEGRQGFYSVANILDLSGGTFSVEAAADVANVISFSGQNVALAAYAADFTLIRGNARDGAVNASSFVVDVTLTGGAGMVSAYGAFVSVVMRQDVYAEARVWAEDTGYIQIDGRAYSTVLAGGQNITVAVQDGDSYTGLYAANSAFFGGIGNNYLANFAAGTGYFDTGGGNDTIDLSRFAAETVSVHSDAGNLFVRGFDPWMDRILLDNHDVTEIVVRLIQESGWTTFRYGEKEIIVVGQPAVIPDTDGRG